MNAGEMRKVRVKELIMNASALYQKGEINIDTLIPRQEQIEDGQFFSKYLDNVNNRQYT